MIYLDNAASTRPSEEVIKVMTDTMRESYGNPDAIHDFSHEIFLILQEYILRQEGQMEIILLFRELLKQIQEQRNI